MLLQWNATFLDDRQHQGDAEHIGSLGECRLVQELL